ncbi:MAG: TonB-dependent receptor [Gammaproteobacteria bacterium]|nr:TonB-dependent receptor [Gammaproteobacteria bacterium]
MTGTRATIQSSIEVKRESMTIVDAISADQIGELPALSIGEAIETVTGAATHREKGGASEIAIRGLGPFLGGATFNGREASNGSGDRSVNFNQFPSEVINTVKIYKTQQADLVEGAVAGLVAMETLKPLDYGKSRLQVEGKLNYNPYQERLEDDNGPGWRGTVSYVDQFDFGDFGEFGLSIGVQRNDVTNPEEVYSSSTTWTACNATAAPVLSGNCPSISRAQGVAGTPFYLVPNSRTFRQISESDEREAIFTAFQWRPSDTVEVNLDVQYSDRSFEEDRSDLNFSEAQRGITNQVIGDNGALLAYDGSSSIESTNTFRIRTEEYKGGGLNVAWQATERLKLAVDAAWSETYRSEIDRQTRLRSDNLDIFGNPTANNNQRVSYSYDARNGGIPSFTVNPLFDLNDHALFSDDARLRRDEQVRENEIKALRFDGQLTFDSGAITKLSSGIRYSELTYTDYDDRVEITQNDRAVDAAVNLACRRDFPQDDFLDGVSGNTISSWATFDPLCLFREYLGTEDPGSNADVRSPANNDVEEQTWAAYVMADFETTLGDIPMFGNFGVRIVDREAQSRGLRSELQVITNPDASITLVPTGEYTGVKFDSDSFDILPSINAIFELREDLLLRGAIFRAISRPDPSALGAGRTFNLDNSSPSYATVEDAIADVTADGSPGLTTLPSWNFDLSLEYYLDADTMLGTALYYKRFQGGFIPVTNIETFVIDDVSVSTPVAQTKNSDEASNLTGFELTMTHRFSYLPQPFDGLGAKLSYNYAMSDFESHDGSYGDTINPTTGAVEAGFLPSADIFGLSENVFSGQIYYQIGDFDAGIIYKYRDDYYQAFVSGTPQLRYVTASETVDLRASYAINDNVSLRFEALNIFDEPRYSDMPVQGNVREVNDYGAKYWFGVRVKI